MFFQTNQTICFDITSFDLAPLEWHQEKKCGFFPPIESVKPIKDILDETGEKDKVACCLTLKFASESKYIRCTRHK